MAGVLQPRAESGFSLCGSLPGEQSRKQTKCVPSVLTEDLRLSWVKDVASCLSVCLSLLSVVCVYPVMMRLTCCVC